MTITFNTFWFERAVDLIKILVIFGVCVGSVPAMVLLERKLMAWIQQRSGPNRVSIPWFGGKMLFQGNKVLGGLLQTLMDGIKLILKEDIVPTAAVKPLHTIAPLFNIIPAIVLLSILPFGPEVLFKVADFSLLGLTLDLPEYPAGFAMPIGIANPEIGILFYMAVAGISVYGIVLAGWSSNSKYSLLGGIRSTAQMLSYELALGLSILGLLLIAGTLDLRTIIEQQDAGFWTWHVCSQPIGFLLFMTAGFAETNRLPFDLPEGESELGGGFHTEYSSMKFAMFFMAEYMNMLVFSVILSTLFLGGFHWPLPAIDTLFGMLAPGTWLHGLWGCAAMGLKVFLMVSFMIFIRSTWPRFRYDQLMDIGWKLMLPWALVNLVLTAGILVWGPSTAGRQTTDPLPLGLTAVLFVIGAIQLLVVDRGLTVRKKRLLASC
jgi:NADH-quinone oxidoreductase subunit H